MSEWIRSGLDLVLIGLVCVGLIQAARLIKHLAGLRQGRNDMEQFVHEFNSTVIRAENGIKGLRQAARDSGDDLEKLVAKAAMIRDELHFIVGSADLVAERLSQSATHGRSEPTAPPVAPATTKSEREPTVTSISARKSETTAPTSRAEKELLQALQKLS